MDGRHLATTCWLSRTFDTGGEFGGCYVVEARRETKRGCRVLALGVSAIQAATRTKSAAAAVRTCPRCVRAKPRQRERRSPERRTPCEIVPSMPARLLYDAA
jgi:hypothetical protein